MASFTISAILGHSPSKEDKTKEPHDIVDELTADAAFETGLCLSSHSFLLSGGILVSFAQFISPLKRRYSNRSG